MMTRAVRCAFWGGWRGRREDAPSSRWRCEPFPYQRLRRNLEPVRNADNKTLDNDRVDVRGCDHNRTGN